MCTVRAALPSGFSFYLRNSAIAIRRVLSTHVLPSLLPQTSNQYLCYYKNQDSQDLLACIDLRSVGDIAKARRIIGIMMTIPFFAIANCLTIEGRYTRIALTGRSSRCAVRILSATGRSAILHQSQNSGERGVVGYGAEAAAGRRCGGVEERGKVLPRHITEASPAARSRSLRLRFRDAHGFGRGRQEHAERRPV